jgi:hypothetical protein
VAPIALLAEFVVDTTVISGTIRVAAARERGITCTRTRYRKTEVEMAALAGVPARARVMGARVRLAARPRGALAARVGSRRQWRRAPTGQWAREGPDPMARLARSETVPRVGRRLVVLVARLVRSGTVAMLRLARSETVARVGRRLVVPEARLARSETVARVGRRLVVLVARLVVPEARLARSETVPRVGRRLVVLVARLVVPEARLARSETVAMLRLARSETVPRVGRRLVVAEARLVRSGTVASRGHLDQSGIGRMSGLTRRCERRGRRVTCHPRSRMMSRPRSSTGPLGGAFAHLARTTPTASHATW